MNIRLDGFTLSLRVHTSLRYPLPPTGNDEEIARHDLARKLLDIQDEAEYRVAEIVCKALGYDRARIEATQEAIRIHEEETLAAEAKGRAEKHAAREAAGM